MHAVCFSLKLIIMLIKQMCILKILASLIMKFGNVSPYEQKLSDYSHINSGNTLCYATCPI